MWVFESERASARRRRRRLGRHLLACLLARSSNARCLPPEEAPPTDFRTEKHPPSSTPFPKKISDPEQNNEIWAWGYTARDNLSALAVGLSFVMGLRFRSVCLFVDGLASGLISSSRLRFDQSLREV